ncbi:MAG: DEAD/DEAH box helicase [Planctomycetes bacterium]|nr:DEAD/DEAH box helicase [Planctomycetota bacterium]
MSAPSREAWNTIKARLPRTFDTLFAHFGSLRAIQEEGLPVLLDGHDVLLCAPTAGGKTEALVAPAAEEILTRREHGLHLLYISPTRALVNDLYRRLEPPLRKLGIHLARKTADHAFRAKFETAALITTPEGLDSLLTRRPETVTSVRRMVLDEIHLLDGTPRGDHLAVLVERLRRIAQKRSGKLIVTAGSATVPDPEDLASRYLHEPVVVRAGGGRAIDADIVPTLEWRDLANVLVSALGGKPGKILVFANSRDVVEKAARHLQGLSPFNDQVYVHHGSLAKEERERVERSFFQHRTALCFATMTLELGIDIGDVDHVVLLGAPHDAMSFTQRIGRSNRRGSRIRVLCCERFCGDQLHFEHLLHCARAGLLPRDPSVIDPSVALQQTLSLLYQSRSRRIRPKDVLDRLPAYLQRFWSSFTLREAFETMEREGWLMQADRDRFMPGPKLEHAYERATMHGNLSTARATLVRDASTGQMIGAIQEDDLAGAGGRGGVLLGGRTGSLTVNSNGELVFQGDGREGKTRFPVQPAPPVSLAHATSLKSFLGYAEDTAPLFPAGSYYVLLHGLGTLASRLLGLTAPIIPIPGVAAYGAFLLRPELPDLPTRAMIRDAVENALPGFARLLGFGPWFRFLPSEEQRRAVFLGVQIDRILEHVHGLRLEPETRPEKIVQLAHFLRLESED